MENENLLKTMTEKQLVEEIAKQKGRASVTPDEFLDKKIEMIKFELKTRFGK